MNEPQLIDFYHKENKPKYLEPINIHQKNKTDPICLVAKSNYTLFYKKDPETVYFSDVEQSSAGIEGWACAGPYFVKNNVIQKNLLV